MKNGHLVAEDAEKNRTKKSLNSEGGGQIGERTIRGEGGGVKRGTTKEKKKHHKPTTLAESSKKKELVTDRHS